MLSFFLLIRTTHYVVLLCANYNLFFFFKCWIWFSWLAVEESECLYEWCEHEETRTNGLIVWLAPQDNLIGLLASWFELKSLSSWENKLHTWARVSIEILWTYPALILNVSWELAGYFNLNWQYNATEYEGNSLGERLTVIITQTIKY